MNTMNKFKLAAIVLAAAACSSAPVYAQQAAAAPQSPAGAEAPAAQASGPRPLDEIAAVVNDDVITEFELQQRTHITALNIRRQNIQLPPMEQLRAQVLDQLILDKVMMQKAKDAGIRVDDPMVSAAIEQIAASNKVTVEQMRDELAKDNIPFQTYRESIRREIILQRLREKEVDSTIQIPESEIDSYLAEQSGYNGVSPTEYRLSHILIPVEQGMDEQQVKQTADSVLERARAGEDFGSLAVSYSKASDSLSGGELGWRTNQSMPTVLWEAIKGEPKKGNVSMIKDSAGFHIVKINDVRDGMAVKVSETKVRMTRARHILMTVSQLTPEATVLSRLTEIRKKIASGESDFQTMARLHSVDGSATKGGDLGWVQAGDTVPEFEQVMDNLPIGQISEPFKSRFGYHLLQVEERKEATADPRRARMAARMALREKKLADAVTNWQRELRDSAYVEIRQPAE